MNKTYRTNDLQLASYLLASGYSSYYPVKEGNIVYFEFDPYFNGEPLKMENELAYMEDNYWTNSTTIEPKKLFAAYNELRLRMRNMTQ